MFDIHQSIYDRHGEIDEGRVENYINGLMDAFVASAEAQSVFDEYGGSDWPTLMMEYAIDYIGVTPPKMSLADFNEVVFQLFPRKVSTEADNAVVIVAELRAFWTFLHRQYGLTNAVAIAASLTNTAVKRLERELTNPANHGMAKSFFMLGKQAGFDMTTQEGLDEFMAVYNSSLLNRATDTTDASSFPPMSDFPSPLSPKQRAEKRKKSKAQRQARKRRRK